MPSNKKISEQQKDTMAQLYHQGYMNKEIAKEMGVCEESISKFVRKFK